MPVGRWESFPGLSPLRPQRQPILIAAENLRDGSTGTPKIFPSCLDRKDPIGLRSAKPPQTLENDNLDLVALLRCYIGLLFYRMQYSVNPLLTYV